MMASAPNGGTERYKIEPGIIGLPELVRPRSLATMDGIFNVRGKRLRHALGGG